MAAQSGKDMLLKLDETGSGSFGTVAGSGIFKDASSDATIRSLFFAGTIRYWQLILPDFGTVEGPFQIVALEFSADHAGEVTFELALESAGQLGFSAA